MAPDRIGLRIERLCRRRRASVRVKADVAQIISEAGFEKGAVGGIQRVTGRSHDVLHNGRRRYQSGFGCTRKLQGQPPGAAGRALAVRPVRSTAGAPTLGNRTGIQ